MSIRAGSERKAIWCVLDWTGLDWTELDWTQSGLTAGEKEMKRGSVYRFCHAFWLCLLVLFDEGSFTGGGVVGEGGGGGEGRGEEGSIYLSVHNTLPAILSIYVSATAPSNVLGAIY